MIYGDVRTAEATGKREYLDLAETLAEYYLATNGPGSGAVLGLRRSEYPACARDRAASAIAASALLDLAALHPDAGQAARWKNKALALLTELCRHYLATEQSHRGLLREGCYSMPHKEGVASAVMFGDFFFAEALCSVVMPGKLRATPVRLSA